MSVKRSLNANKTSNDETKKFRMTNNNVNVLITRFENLSNEIYYEIFDYLDGCHIYETFSNLNIRFQQLITSPSLFLKISIDDETEFDMKNCWKRVIASNKNRIVSLHLWNSTVLDGFFKHCVIDSLFSRLQSIVLYDLLSSKLRPILSSLKSIPNLFALNIKLIDNGSGSLIDLTVVYQMIFCLSSLKFNSLTIPMENETNSLMTFPIHEQFSTIESLMINHRCTTNELTSLLCYTPRLHRLACQSLNETDANIGNNVSITSSNLSYITIDYCSLAFVDLEKLLTLISSQLRVLHIGEFRHTNYVDPGRWKVLILENMPCLVKFTVKCLMNVDDNFPGLYLDAFVHQFTSQFWINRGWILKVDIDHDEVYYSIFSCRKTLLNSNDDRLSRLKTNHTHTQLSPSIELYMENNTDIEWHPSFYHRFSSILSALHFKRLSISCTSLSVITFVKILDLLPKLDSLSVSSLPVQQWSNLSNEESERVRTISKSNKITKVRQWMNMELTQFLIDLCPRMEYFKVHWIDDTDLEKLVRLILGQIVTHIPRLHLLRCYVSNNSDELIGNLRKMIERENLLFDYNIERCGNNITLGWKLQ